MRDKHQEIQEAFKEFMKKNARKGGLAVKKKYGRDYYSKIGKKAALARWGKKK